MNMNSGVYNPQPVQQQWQQQPAQPVQPVQPAQQNFQGFAQTQGQVQMPQQQQQPMQQQAQQHAQQTYDMDFFKQEGFEMVADGDRNPLKMGVSGDVDMLPGEQIIGTVQSVHYGESKFQGQGEAKPFGAIQIKIAQVRNNQKIMGQVKTLFLRGQYLDSFYNARWGINDTLSVGYGGKQETGRGNARNLIYIQGKKAPNSVFVPKGDDIDKTATPAAPVAANPFNEPFAGVPNPGTQQHNSGVIPATSMPPINTMPAGQAIGANLQPQQPQQPGFDTQVPTF